MKHGQFSGEQLILLLVEPPASPSVLPACVKDSQTPAATWPSSTSELLIAFAPGGLSGKTSPVYLVQGGGRDFGSFIGGIQELGYSCAWRVLDAQFWGVPQRRRRVFVVGNIGDWRGPAKVLFDPEGGDRNYPPRGTQGASASSGTNGGFEKVGDHGLIHSPLTSLPYSDRGDRPEDLVVACALNGNYKSDSGDVSQNLIVMAHGQSSAEVCDGFSPALACNHEAPILSRTVTRRFDSSEDGTDRGLELMPSQEGVRRLTPLECERLQGFPDNWTLIGRGSKLKPAADGPRYKAIGNSMAVPVIRWLGKRIEQVERGDL